MSTLERRRPQTASTDAVLRRVDRRLRRLDLRRVDRLAITADLHADLLAAEADGRDPADLIGPDVDRFALRTVVEGDYVIGYRGPARLALLGTLAAVPAVVVAHLVALGVIQPLFTAFVSPFLNLPHFGDEAAWLATGVISLLGALPVVGLLLHGRPGARSTMKVAPIALALAAAVAVSGNRAVLEGASEISPLSVVIQVLCGVVPLAVALLVARWWGLRQSGETAPVV
ncbi:hypothetical protein SAMN06264364_1353 [Quadrisphaera granulorum]|uniref:Uncharacterized protein n=1 Tax=Quadrisphaera granulorum TaxID=317664 RepID=A0A315ZRR4_9ACTN|nr:hypothetical protein [Quadrisphaera granulorum]PWJ47700.1 hypothetical protein BXY45_1353 [Quadrisphaera granulorum]SZE98654.1 hypothetical protein SAMN06264364_1353 [Quadrisphaera granulorum]